MRYRGYAFLTEKIRFPDDTTIEVGHKKKRLKVKKKYFLVDDFLIMYETENLII